MLYISGEESADQIRLRARRLGLDTAPLSLATTINVRDIVGVLEAERDLALVVIDSIQTMWLDSIESAPGTVTQVRASGFELIRQAKQRGFCLVLVGHVTKDGALAGPRVLEHMVDAVLHFEGDRGHQFRILRAAKNRFGATDEIGVFEMTGHGLAEVANPSALFLAERRGHIAGSAVFAGLEGSRPVLLEIQVLLAANNGGGAPRRQVVGWDGNRLSMLLAVLDARCGLQGRRGRRLPQRRRGPARGRAGGGPGGGGGAGLGRDRASRRGRARSTSARSGCRARCARSRRRTRGSRRRRSWGSRRRCCRDGGGGRRRRTGSGSTRWGTCRTWSRRSRGRGEGKAGGAAPGPRQGEPPWTGTWKESPAGGGAGAGRWRSLHRPASLLLHEDTTARRRG